MDCRERDELVARILEKSGDYTRFGRLMVFRGNGTIKCIIIYKYLGDGRSVFSGRNPRVKKVLIREWQ